MERNYEIEQIAADLEVYVLKDKRQEFIRELTEILEKVQREAFRNGYEYAIELLQESIVKVPDKQGG